MPFYNHGQFTLNIMSWPKSWFNILHNIFTVLFHYLLLFFSKFYNSFLSKHFYLFQKTVLITFSNLPQNWIARINGHPKVINTVDEGKPYSQTVKIFAWSPNMQSSINLMKFHWMLPLIQSGTCLDRLLLLKGLVVEDAIHILIYCLVQWWVVPFT